jgi:hypothetical protein
MRAEAPAAIAGEPLNTYLKSIVDAASEWMSGIASKDYPNYQKMIELISKGELRIAGGKRLGLDWYT